MNLKETEFNHIGLIPINWDVVRLKDIAQINKGSVFDEKLASVDGIYPYINGGINPSDWSNYFNTKENTIAVSEGGASAGYTQFMTTKYWAGSHCYKIQSKNKKSDNKYLFYVLKGFEKYLMIEKTGSAMPNLQKTKFINYLVSFVNNVETQDKIVTFLDIKTSNIDRKISILEQKAKKIEEYKQSAIFETVTKGLDSLAPTKDSGIDWIGNIPTHWEIKRVKDVAKWKTGFTPDTKKPEYYEGSDDWVTIGDMDGRYIKTTQNKINGSLFPKSWKTSANSLLFSFKLSIGQVAFNEKEVFTNEAICSFSPKSDINLRYLYYIAPVFIARNAKKNIYGADLLNQELISNAYIICALRDEQIKIADYLDSICLKIDKKKEIVKKQIELLKEYKQSIIYEAVTGKTSIGDIVNNTRHKEVDLFKFNTLKDKTFDREYLEQLGFRFEELSGLLDEHIWDTTMVSGSMLQNNIDKHKIYRLNNLGLACIEEISKLFEITKKLNNKRLSFDDYKKELTKENTKLSVEWFLNSLALHKLVSVEEGFLKIKTDKLKTLI